jgi:hypothetical protein
MTEQKREQDEQKPETPQSDSMGALEEQVEQKTPPAATINDTEETGLNPYSEISPG